MQRTVPAAITFSSATKLSAQVIALAESGNGHQLATKNAHFSLCTEGRTSRAASLDALSSTSNERKKHGFIQSIIYDSPSAYSSILQEREYIRVCRVEEASDLPQYETS